jgi:glycosyltransferase involved in cell wall biosynthesis
MIRIAYLFQSDASNPGVQSGRPASILRHLTAQGASIVPVFPLATRVSRASTLKKALYRLAGRYYRGDREPGFLRAVAAEFERRTRGKEYDIAFCPGSEAVSHLDIPRPIAFCADATFANMIDYYWDFSSLSSEYVRKGHRQEANALRRASLAVYPSEWAARSAVDFYHADPARVAVVPFGANFGAQNEREQVHRWIAGRRFDCLRLLFVGKSWKRKGGSLVVEAAQRLLQRGFRVNLDIVSGEAPHGLRRMPWITQHGQLDPGEPSSAGLLADLFKGAHFVFIPSRAEAYGMAFAEANAFGVPAIGTATGGIPSIIRDGFNGYTLPLSAGAPAFADLIAGAFARRELYHQLCRNSFEEFERRLNWRTFCSRFLDLASQQCESLAQRTGGPCVA